jgi:hypothetical protein
VRERQLKQTIVDEFLAPVVRHATAGSARAISPRTMSATIRCRAARCRWRHSRRDTWARCANGEELLLTAADGERADAEDWRPERLPSIVLVVDEFADLIMVADKELDAVIARLGQKARAAGIHVILATQRPSTDVIRGTIKANFPGRIGFKVTQREDSKRSSVAPARNTCSDSATCCA